MSAVLEPHAEKLLPQIRDPFFYGWRDVLRVRPDGSEFWEQVPLTEWDVLHPQEEDFIVHNDVHGLNVMYLRHAFDLTLAGRPGTLVLSDHRIDWEVPGIRPLGPDVAVFFGVTGWRRQQVGTFPVKRMTAKTIVAIEVTSPSTIKKDVNEKVDLYFRNGVPLYLIAETVEEGGTYSIIWIIYKATPEGYVRVFSDEAGRYRIDALGVSVGVEGEYVVVFDAQGNRIPNHVELNRQHRAALEQVEDEKKRAEDEKKRAEDEKKRADATITENDDLKRRMADMEAELRRLRGES